jgi:glucoamylase
LQDVQVFDLPQTSLERYLKKQVCSPNLIWRFNHKCRTIPAGKNLLLELLAEDIIHWSSNELKEVIETKTRDTGIGIHLADIPTFSLKTGKQIHFTFFYLKRTTGRDRIFLLK